MPLHHHERSHMTQRAAGISLAVALVLIAMQLYAYFETNAMVILASVLESVIDAIASAAALFALRTAHKGPDHNHRYGHGKAEPLVTLGQAAFVAGSGVYFILESIQRMLNPEPLQSTGIGIAVMMVSSLMILALLLYQSNVIRRTRSMSIKADFLHYMNDMVVNGLVILALLLSHIQGYHWIDAGMSIIIALYILYAAYRLGRDAAGELMDLELQPKERNAILGIIQQTPGVSGVHDLRTRRSGPDVFIEAHVEMLGQMTLDESHQITDRLESALLAEFPTAHITLHQEPAGIQDHRLDAFIRDSA